MELLVQFNNTHVYRSWRGMLRRPKPRETEEDLLALQEQFLASRDRPSANIVNTGAARIGEKRRQAERDVVQLFPSDSECGECLYAMSDVLPPEPFSYPSFFLLPFLLPSPPFPCFNDSQRGMETDTNSKPLLLRSAPNSER